MKRKTNPRNDSSPAVSCLSLAVSASAAGTTTRKATDFKDYDRTAWYAEAVSAAVDNGLLYGKIQHHHRPERRHDPRGDGSNHQPLVRVLQNGGHFAVQGRFQEQVVLQRCSPRRPDGYL